MFCGTPEFALPSLRLLAADTRISVEAVVTQPDRPRGRGQEIAASAVKSAALDAALHVYQPEKIKSDSACDFFQRVAPDAVVIIAYGQIIPARLLNIPRLGWINLHASLLPRYRGAAPINWAIIQGQTRSGLTTMQIDPGLDTGPVLLQLEMDIGAEETAPALAARMAQAGAPMVQETLLKFSRGEIYPVPQDHSQASFAPLLQKENGRIDWSLPAQQIYNLMRGVDPWPGAFSYFRGQLCHLWGRPAASREAQDGAGPAGAIRFDNRLLLVSCGAGDLFQVSAVQLEGRRRVAALDFAHGARLAPGERFGS